MVKFEKFDKRGEVISKCTTHYYAEGVGIDEPVIIPHSVAFDLTDLTIWGFTDVEILRRAKELDADVAWKEMMPENPYDEPKTKMWFSNSGVKK